MTGLGFLHDKKCICTKIAPQSTDTMDMRYKQRKLTVRINHLDVCNSPETVVNLRRHALCTRLELRFAIESDFPLALALRILLVGRLQGTPLDDVHLVGLCLYVLVCLSCTCASNTGHCYVVNLVYYDLVTCTCTQRRVFRSSSHWICTKG